MHSGRQIDPLTHREEDQANYYVQQVATAFANSVDVQFYFNFDEGPMTDRWAFGMVGRSQAYMKAIYFAAATMTRKTDYADTFRQEQLQHLGDVFLTTVIKDGAETLIIWKAAGAVDVEIETTARAFVASDVYGNAFALLPSRKGVVYLTLTQSPVYIDCKRMELKRIEIASFHLAAHHETVSAGQKTSSLRLVGTPPAGCVGALEVGFLSTKSTDGTLTTDMNVVVPAHGVMLGEVYEAVLWIMDSSRQGQARGRLASSVNVRIEANDVGRSSHLGSERFLLV